MTIITLFKQVKKTLWLTLFLCLAGPLFAGLLQDAGQKAQQSTSTPFKQPFFKSAKYSDTGHLSINAPAGKNKPVALDVWLMTTDAARRKANGFASAKFTFTSKESNPSYIQYGEFGDWIVQSSYEDKGIVYMQPRGGDIHIGSKLTDGNDPTKRASDSSKTNLNVYADASHFYKPVYVYDPSDASKKYDVYKKLGEIKVDQSDFVKKATKKQDGGTYNTGLLGVNTTPKSVLDILSDPNGVFNPAASARFRRSNNSLTPSYIHYLAAGHWVIQSIETDTGVVYLQPRGGTIQIGTDLTRQSARGTVNEIISKLEDTVLKVHAKESHFYKKLYVYDGATKVDVVSKLKSIVALDQVQKAKGYEAETTMKAASFIDFGSAAYALKPSSTSVLKEIKTHKLIDHDDTDYVLDLDKTTSMNNLEIKGKVNMKNMLFASGALNYSFSLVRDNLMLDSNEKGLSNGHRAYYFSINRSTHLGTKNKVKLNIEATLADEYKNRLNGIYFGGESGLTFQSQGGKMLLLNPENKFTKVHMGDPDKDIGVTTQVNGVLHVNGRQTVKKSVWVGQGVTAVGAIKAKEFVGYGTVPKGAILMWSGKVEDIEDGWALCNGQNGTPDLRGRFVIAAGQGSGLSNRSVGQKGGAETHKLSKDEMPQHRHAIWLDDWKGGGDWGFDWGGGGGGKSAGADGNSSYTRFEGGNKPHNNMPPYYALAYIMRIK